jgi:cytochrome oxidase Cu insertion factor (SCO1/SenC/PrrC family)
MKAVRTALLAIVAIAAASGAHRTARAQVQARPPVHDFVAPAVGTYRLPPIQDATSGWVLEGSYFPHRLARYTHDAYTLLTFVYTYCSDPIGCPLAYSTLDAVKSGVIADERLRGKVRLVCLSFDPTNDTPDAMQIYGGAHARDTRVPWHFLTTYSMTTLEPILDGYGQDIEVVYDAQGKATRARTHMLKMFLIDRQGRVREIYSSAFLQPDVILNDIRTLAMEDGALGTR